MSGHSKWSTIKRQKGVADTKRGQTFTKIANAITVAVREGASGDPATNFRLRLVVEQARAVNMPKENIGRAIDRGLGKGGSGGQLESVIYEGYGPGKTALMVEAVTDNRNRTNAEIRGLIERAGGSFASPGAVSWMFADEGVIALVKGGKSFEEIFEMAVAAGATDVDDIGDAVLVYTKANELEKVKNALLKVGLAVESAEVAKKPSTVVEISDAETAKKLLALMEKLEQHNDVQKVWSNFDISEGLPS